MNRVAERFAKLKEQGRKALIPYIMGGDPNLESLPGQLTALVESGADLIEIGVPFSDPLADGPVIQAAGLRALQAGADFAKLMEALRRVGPGLPIPLMLMVYYNQIHRIGTAQFLEKIKAAGVAGLIIPDLPPEEAGQLHDLADQAHIALNFLVAPTSSTERIRAVAGASTGFVYAVSLKGVTGVRAELPPELPQFIRMVKANTTKPVAVGFGIATAAQAKIVGALADGVIVGSAVVRSIAADASLKELRLLLHDMRSEL
jgi:tryptophan synthase alpha chain